jgi:4-amino-4-deoxy-L-arabinose transferase-like glycosyltransferase
MISGESASPMKARLPPLGGLAAAWAVLVAAGIALRPVVPVDETRYLSVAWEMWLRHDLLVPHLNGQPYSDKPPMMFWLFHLGWSLFGVSEVWPRLVPGLLSLADAGLTALLARRLWPDRPAVARLAPAVLLGLLLWAVFTTMLMFDLLVAFFELLALIAIHAAWSRWREGRGGGWACWIAAGVAMGLGILSKGPVALLIPLLVAASAFWWGDGVPGRARWTGGALLSVSVAAAVALAWALPAAHAGGPAYARAILFSQTGERVVSSFAHNRPWWWYLPLLPVMLFPYSLFPPVWRRLARLRPGVADPGVRFCLAWFVPALIAFSLISGKQPHYLLPLLPAFALVVARWLDDAREPARRLDLLPAAAVVILAGLAIAAAPWLAPPGKLPDWAGLVSPLAGVALVAGAVAVLALPWLWRLPAAPSLLGVLLVVGLLFGFHRVARQVYDLRPIARFVGGLEREGRPIAFVGLYHGELHFLGRLRRPFETIEPGMERAWIAAHPDGKVVEPIDDNRDLRRADYSQRYRQEALAVWGREALLGS